MFSYLCYNEEVYQPGKGGNKVSLQFILGNGQKDHRKALIDEAAAWLDKDEDRQLKMKDLQLIFSAFEEELVQRALQSEDALTVLANYMATQDYHKIKFLVSGFARINAQEYQLLQKMMEKGHLVVDLLLDL